MFLPPDPFHPHTWSELQKRTIRQLRSSHVEDRVFEAVQKLFESDLNSQDIVLSRPERDRLLRSVMKEVLGEMLAKLDGAN